MTIGTQAKTKKAAGNKAAATAIPAKAATKIATTLKAAPARPATAKPARAAPAKAAKPQVSSEQRRHYIEVAAYYIAERRGFSGASVHDDWVQAEFEIDQLLREGRLGDD